MKKLLFSTLIIFLFFLANAQCLMRPISLSDRATASSLIIEGKVISKQSSWNSLHNMIYTTNTIEVYKIFKGNITTTSVEIITAGGIVGLNKIVVDPALHLNIGDIGVFTCENLSHIKGNVASLSGLPQYETYASVQGFVKYDLTSQTAADPFTKYTNIETEIYNKVLSPSLKTWKEIAPFNVNVASAQKNNQPIQVQSISGFAPTTVTAGTGTQITITGSGFGATQGSGTVGFKSADDGGSTFINPLATQYISWSNTQIVVEVPSGAGTGVVRVTQGATQTSTQTLTINYAHLNVEFDPGSGTEAYGTDHVNDNGSGGYTWRMNTAFAADALANASFMRAFDTWRCNTGVNWTIGTTTSINDAVSDGTNIICFDNTAPLSAGVLGTCYSYWSGCASGPTIIWYVNELDIIFDEGSNITPLTWEYGTATPSGSEYDFETVAVHELGHGHQLGHVISPGAIMHYAISNGTSNRSLGVNDLAGGNFVQAKSIIGNVCGPGAMTNHSCGTAPVAGFSATPTTVCAGDIVSFTDISTNTPTSWSWNFPGGSPSSSTSQNPTVTYNTPGVYSVTLTATNASGSDAASSTNYITVNAIPTINASASSTNICSGSTTTLTASGGSSYSWNTGATTSVISVSPTTSTTYTVTGTLAGCSNTDMITISVNSLPNVSISGSSTLCAGTSSVLTASGAISYLWNTGATTATISVSPSSLTVYTVTGTNSSGCVNTATRSVNPIACGGAETATTSVTCGLVIYNMNVSSSAVNVIGAVQYRFNFYDNVTNALIASKTQASRTFTFNSVSGLYYGNTYKWTVAVDKGIGFGPESSNGCTVIFNAPITNLPCGNSFNNLNITNAAQAVYSATGYRFSFYDNSTNALIATKTQASNTINFSTVSGLNYGKTYRWRVEVQYNNGSTLLYGPASSNSLCTITFKAPQATLPCGNTYPATSASIGFPSVSGANSYRVTFYDNATNALVAAKVFGTNYVYFNQVPGLVYNSTYKWTVEVNYNNGTSNVYGPASTNTCTVTWGATSLVINQGGDTERLMNNQEDMDEHQPVITVYPNPNNGSFNVATNKNMSINIVNEFGQIVRTQTLNQENNYEISIKELANGIYFLIGQTQDNNVLRQKIIVNQ